MSEGITAAEIQEGRHDRKSSSLAILPSWFISLCLHATLLYMLATHLPASWGPGSTNGEQSGEFREVGIFVKGGGEDGGAAGTPDGNAENEQPGRDEPIPAVANPKETNPLDIPRADDSVVSDKPPVPLDSPLATNPVLGPGISASETPPASVRDTLANQRKLGDAGTGAGRGSGSGPGQGGGGGTGVGSGVAPFFGIGDRGTRFVYVIDCSGSMAFNSAIRVAKDELMSSLEGLERTQQFQIIFYDTQPRPMLLTGERGEDLYWATTANRNAARRYIANVQPQQGTDHMPALELAIRLKPEVIFFLTDADLPELDAGDLNRIQRINGDRSRIHCIRFGQGADLEATNFMKKLAAQNGGRYRYRDVKSFQ